MNLRWPSLLSVMLAVASVLLFLLGGHFTAKALVAAQQAKQLAELSNVALRRSESTVDFGVDTLSELAQEGEISCDASRLQSVRLHVYEHGAVKDIRLVDHGGAILCSAYSETLEFDKGWLTREQMLPARDAAVRLFRVDQFFGIALGVMRDVDPRSGLVAILGINGSLFDIMPAELQNHSDVTLELANGQVITHSSQDGQNHAQGDAVSLTAVSDRYPIRTIVRVEKSALARWDQEPYLPIVSLAGVLGLAFGVLLARAFDRPPSPARDLDRAIAAHEFHPYLQPLFDLDSGAIVGAEILARWVKADGTVIPPSRFIELAEDAGRIGKITWQLLSSALKDLKPVLKQDKLFKLSINIAPRHFMAPGFIDDLRDAVAESGVATRQITLEITEREAFEDLGAAAETVADVRSYGFKVAIDDVGIGHSGLSQIQRLRADILKIDKFFVDCIDRDASAGIVVEMLVRMASEMSMSIVAEGIETPEQRAALIARGVHCGQGFLVAPPLPVPAFRELLEKKSLQAAEMRLNAKVA